MDRILDLMISYPDFQLNQIIDPDQVDTNNSQIVTKVNMVINAINTLTQGETGSTNITIKPLPEFPNAKTVQTALEQIATYTKSNNTTIAQILAHNTSQDNRMTTIEAKNTEQDNTLSTHNDVIANHSQRVTMLEISSSDHSNRIGSLEERALNTETKNTEQDNRLNIAESINVQQDRNIVALQVFDDSLDRRVTSTESKNRTQDTQITKLQSDVAGIISTNTNAEVIDARTDLIGTIHTTLKKRIDEADTGVGATLTSGQRGKMNMILTSSDDTSFWEDGIAIGSLNDHNNSPNAHTTLIANHELDNTSHQDIRDAINAINPVVDWEGIENKPVTFPPAPHQHNKADIKDFTHGHSASEITGLPISLPANGGNADTVDGKHASDFVSVGGGSRIAQGTSYQDPSGQWALKVIQGTDANDRNGLYVTARYGGSAVDSIRVDTTWNGGMSPIPHFRVRGDGLTCISKLQLGSLANVEGEINNLKSSVSSGKASVANAITAKGVATSTTAEFATMASNIGKISGVSGSDGWAMCDKLITYLYSLEGSIASAHFKNIVDTVCESLIYASKVSTSYVGNFPMGNRCAIMNGSSGGTYYCTQVSGNNYSLTRGDYSYSKTLSGGTAKTIWYHQK